MNALLALADAAIAFVLVLQANVSGGLLLLAILLALVLLKR